MAPKRGRNLNGGSDASARQMQKRDTIVNVRSAALWVARRIAEGALPEIGKRLAGWAWQAGAGLAAGWVLDQWWR